MIDENRILMRMPLCLQISQKAAVDHVKAAREEAEAQALAQRDGGASLELLQAAFQGVVQKRGHHNTHFRERLFVLDKGVLKYYKVENMVIVDGMYCTGITHHKFPALSSMQSLCMGHVCNYEWSMCAPAYRYIGPQGLDLVQRLASAKTYGSMASAH